MSLFINRHRFVNCGNKSVFSSKSHDKVKILKISKKNLFTTKNQLMDLYDVSLIDFIMQKLTVDDLINITQIYIHPAITAMTQFQFGNHLIENDKILITWLISIYSLIPVIAIFTNAFYTFFKNRESLLSIKNTKISQKETSIIFYGVDVSNSLYLKRPSVKSALNFAAKAHRGQIRKTGESYISHCINTALITEDLLSLSIADAKCEMVIIAAILHDVIDDTSITYNELKKAFGKEVTELVKKVSAISSMTQLLRRKRRILDYCNIQNKNEDEMMLGNEHSRSEEDFNLRRSILLGLDDPLALVIKLSDRLHNMRTCYILPIKKRRCIALETRTIFCTLAEHLGLFSLKAELEDLCFVVLEPESFINLEQEVKSFWQKRNEETKIRKTKKKLRYLKMKNKLEKNTNTEVIAKTNNSNIKKKNEVLTWDKLSTKKCEDLLKRVIPYTSQAFSSIDPKTTQNHNNLYPLHFLKSCTEKILYEMQMESFSAGFDTEFYGRVKSLYSTYMKMKRKDIKLIEVYDIIALRIIVVENENTILKDAQRVCYRLLNTIQRLWKSVPEEFDDYIATPKESGYQSLHSVLLSNEIGMPFEVQIRTSTMHMEAEYGTASHWSYKESLPSKIPTSQQNRFTHLKNPEELIGCPVLRIRNGTYTDGIIVAIEEGGLKITVAINFWKNISSLKDGRRVVSEREYEKMKLSVEARNKNSNSLPLTLEQYVLCIDGAYHLIDRFGYKHATIVRTLEVISDEIEEKEIKDEDRDVKEHVRYLRYMLEDYYNDDLKIKIKKMKPNEIHVLVWPEGKICTFPAGTTAGDVLKMKGFFDINGGELDKGTINNKNLINVNNELVDENTCLHDGDYIILTREILQI